MRHWKVLMVCAIVGAVVGLLAYGFTTNLRAIPSTMIGKSAPDFPLTLFDGRTIHLSDFRGKTVFLNFWASWCSPCREEAPLLEAAWRRYEAQGVIFLGVDIQDTEDAARRFLQEFAITYMNGGDPSGRIAIDYGVYGIPESFFMDREGRITYKHVGALDRKTLLAKLGDGTRGLASAEGKGQEYQGISVR